MSNQHRLSIVVKTVYWIDGSDPVRMVCIPGLTDSWRSIQNHLAFTLGCRVEEVDCRDLYWDGDAEMIDAVIVEGKIVGAFKRPLDKLDLAAILANPLNNHANITRPTAPAGFHLAAK